MDREEFTSKAWMQVAPDHYVQYERLSEDAGELEQANPNDAGFDLPAAEAGGLAPGERKLIDTDIAIAIPNELVGFVKPRSGLALNQGIQVMAGTIDPGYRGNVGVLLYNAGDSIFSWRVGDRIAQLVLVESAASNVIIEEIDELPEATRGDDGFGSSGV